MAITTATTDTTGNSNVRHHVNADSNVSNMHHPIGFRDALEGSVLFKNETGNYSYIQSVLPPALDYVDSSATAPTTTVNDVYLLDDSTSILVVTDIEWTSGTSVKISFSGSPDLSGYTTVNNIAYIYGSGITNNEHLGRFVISAIDNSLKTITITNPLITDATKDETTITASAELPHSSFGGASNGDWVRHNGTDFYRVNPIAGVTCYDSTLLTNRTYNGTKWLGGKKEFSIACSDETTALVVATDSATFRIPYKMLITEIRASVVTAPTGSAITVDCNKSGVTFLSTKLTIDATEYTSTTAVTPLVMSSDTLSDDEEITIDIDVIGSTIAGTGLKLTFLGWEI